MTKLILVLFATSCCALLACGSDRPFQVTSACLPASVAAGEPYLFDVFSDCAGKTDYKNLRCEITVKGMTISVATPADKAKDRTSNDDCVAHNIECELPALAPGSYTVEFVAPDGPWLTTLLAGSEETGTAWCHGKNVFNCQRMCASPQDAGLEDAN